MVRALPHIIPHRSIRAPPHVIPHRSIKSRRRRRSGDIEVLVSRTTTASGSVAVVARGVGGQTLAPDSARPAFALEFVKRPRPQSDPVHQRRKTQDELRKGREDGSGQGVHRPPVRRALRALRQERKTMMKN